MKALRGRKALGYALCAAVALALLPAAAQEYPTKPVRLIVGFPPGGATDLVARLVQPKLAQAFKQEIIVDNRAGANGVIGAELAAKAPPDGYTLHLATLAALTISPAIGKVPYDPLKDFTPIARVVELQNIFIVLPALQVTSIGDLVALARSKPGALNYASSGTGSTGHLSGELLRSMAGIDMVHVPYKGGGPALTDFLAGQVDIFVAIVSTAVPYVKSGKARALAVTGQQARRRAARRADGRRKRDRGLRVDELVLPRGTGQPAAADRRPLAPGDRRGARSARYQAGAPRARNRCGAELTERAGGLSPERIGQVVAGGEGGGGAGELTAGTLRSVTRARRISQLSEPPVSTTRVPCGDFTAHNARAFL